MISVENSIFNGYFQIPRSSWELECVNHRYLKSERMMRNQQN